MSKSIRFRALASFAVAILLLLISACEEDLSISSAPPKVAGPKVVYVAPGGSGLGTAESPFGSIQAALDSAVLDAGIGTVLVAVGEYDEHIEIRVPMTIRGGLDPQADWESHPDGSTVIRGERVLGNGVGVLIETNSRVELQDLSIEAPSAGSAGGGSYGISCRNSPNVHLVRCRVRAGNGRGGGAGARGDGGAAGDAGATPAPGMQYASGGHGADAQRKEPERGFCADGSQTGGEAGDDGGNGDRGESGAGGEAVLRWTSDGAALWIGASPGAQGVSGGHGCGGGGGKSGVRILPNAIETIPGGGGGGGGQGGGGGRGGDGGGCSIGLLLYRSTCTATGLVIQTGEGGDGGDGGEGGSGGEGGDGGAGIRQGVLVRSRPGGDGGRGGRGGRGGGGAGGWSAGVVMSADGSLAGDAPTVTLGGSGDGGSPDGAEGQAVEMHVAGE